MPYGAVAVLPWGRERFEARAFAGGADDVILNRQHDRGRPLARTGAGLVLTEAADALMLRAEIPAGVEQDQALADVRAGILRGLSVEFVAVEETDGRRRARDSAGPAHRDRAGRPRAVRGGDRRSHARALRRRHGAATAAAGVGAVKWWPFARSEHRAEPGADSYTSLRLAEALATATTPDPAAVDRSAAAVAAGGLLGRSLAAADVQPAGQVATALEAVLFEIGDWLVRRGECVFVPTFTDRLEFLPGSHVSLSQGRAGPARVAVHRHSERTRPAGSPPAPRPRMSCTSGYTPIPDRPWAGRAPVDTTGGRALVALESALRNEAAAPHGTILPIPERDSSETTSTWWPAMIRKARGNVLPIETPREGMSSVGDARTFRPERFGFEPPQPAVTARDSLGVATGASGRDPARAACRDRGGREP